MDYQTAHINERASAAHYNWVDFVRVFGTFLVVLAHVTGWGAGPGWAETFYYTLSRNGVPLFFMISGFLLLSKQEDLGTYLKKRAWKILIPFVVWSLIYDLYWNQALSEVGLSFQGVIRLFIRMIRGARAEHLWFFYALIGLYLFTPVLRLFVDKARNDDLLYYIGLWFLAVPLLNVVSEFTPIVSGFELQFATGYVGYYLLGLFLGRLELNRKRLIVFTALFLIGFIGTFVVFYLDLPPKNNELIFRSYLSINIILMAVFILMFLRVLGEIFSSQVNRWLNLFSQASFGIYLMHPILMRWIEQGWIALGFDTGIGTSILVIPFIAIIGFLASFVVTMALRKIPILKSIVP